MKTISKLLVTTLCVLASSSAFAGRGSSYGAIVDAINTKNGDVIASELERAERLVCAECVPEVMNLLDNDDYQIREVAAWWFSRRPVLKAAVTLQSVARLQGPDARQAEYAADVLGTFRHPGVLPVLASALSRSDFPASTKVAVVRAIGTIADPDGTPAVLTALGDNTPETRAEAVRAYDTLRGHRTGAELVPLLSDPDVAVRRQAAGTIGMFRFSGARTALENLLAHDSDAMVRRNAAWSLFKLGDPGSRAALAKAASDDPVMYVRSTAKAGLASPR